MHGARDALRIEPLSLVAQEVEQEDGLEVQGGAKAEPADSGDDGQPFVRFREHRREPREGQTSAGRQIGCVEPRAPRQAVGIERPPEVEQDGIR